MRHRQRIARARALRIERRRTWLLRIWHERLSLRGVFGIPADWTPSVQFRARAVSYDEATGAFAMAVDPASVEVLYRPPPPGA